MKIKKFCSLLTTLLLGVFVLTSCDDDDEELIPELKLLSQSVEVTNEGGSYSLAYQLINPVKNATVKAVAGDEWVKVTSITENTIMFDVEVNPNYENRESELSVTYPGVEGVKKCTIIQSSSLRPIIEMVETSMEIPAEGADNVEVKYNVVNPKDGVLPEVTCKADWITDVTVADNIIKFNVNENTDPVIREAEMIVSYEGAEKTVTLVISQAAGATDVSITVGNVTFKMIYVKAGTFMMGAGKDEPNSNSWEKPSHKVTITKDFYMGEYEVTQALWTEIMGNNPSQYKDAGGDLSLPVENINYHEIQEFIAKLNEKTGKTFVLPTEAQWEYAACGGEKSQGYIYSGGNVAEELAWYDFNSGFKTHPVGQKKANELGLYDMCGNVMEWCSDWYGDYSAEEQTDPVGPASSPQNSRVTRGGGLISLEGDLRIVFRAGSEVGSHMFFQGFRLSMVK